jgi:formylglycine-generating enzyme required for sulfatase activity
MFHPGDTLMTDYSTTSSFSIAVVSISVIVFALFFVVRYKNRAKLSPFLMPGLLAAAMLGPVSAIIIGATLFILAIGKINEYGIAHLSLVFGSSNAPLMYSLVAAFFLCSFAIAYLEIKKDRQRKIIWPSAPPKPSKMPVIFSIVTILAGLSPLIPYYQQQTLFACILVPSKIVAQSLAGQAPAAVAMKISSLLIVSLAAGLLAFFVLIAIIMACLFLSIRRNEEQAEFHIQGMYVATILLLLGIGATYFNISSVHGSEIYWASIPKPKPKTVITKSPATITKNPEEIAMVWVKGGTFTMGCTPEQKNVCYENEEPAHPVTLSDFYIGKYEVTQAQWRAVMGENPSNFKGDDFPVEQINWKDAQEFIQRLNAKTGKAYRLPTEAEWEYAARGGAQSKGYKYSGSNVSNETAWCSENSSEMSRPVACKAPNELGLYDMSGNVWEWCSDRYGKYNSEPQSDPHGPRSGATRVIRGGSWNGVESLTRVSYRIYFGPGIRGLESGLRLASSSK